MDVQSNARLDAVVAGWVVQPFMVGDPGVDVLDRKGLVVANVRQWYNNLLYVVTDTGHCIVEGGV